MADLVLELVSLSLALGVRVITAQGSEDETCYTPHIVGPVVVVAVLVEAVTIAIAISSCIYLKRKLKKKKSIEFEQPHVTHDHVYNEEADDGSKTIRVVHNSLYQSMQSDSGTMSPGPLEVSSQEQHFNDDGMVDHNTAPEGRRTLVEVEVDKLRSVTGSSHAYEPINLGTDDEGNISTNYRRSVATENDHSNTGGGVEERSDD